MAPLGPEVPVKIKDLILKTTVHLSMIAHSYWPHHKVERRFYFSRFKW